MYSSTTSLHIQIRLIKSSSRPWGDIGIWIQIHELPILRNTFKNIGHFLQIIKKQSPEWKIKKLSLLSPLRHFVIFWISRRRLMPELEQHVLYLTLLAIDPFETGELDWNNTWGDVWWPFIWLDPWLDLSLELSHSAWRIVDFSVFSYAYD